MRPIALGCCPSGREISPQALRGGIRMLVARLAPLPQAEHRGRQQRGALRELSAYQRPRTRVRVLVSQLLMRTRENVVKLCA